MGIDNIRPSGNIGLANPPELLSTPLRLSISFTYGLSASDFFDTRLFPDLALLAPDFLRLSFFADGLT